MTLSWRNARSFLLFFAAFLLPSAVLAKPAVEAGPWLYRGSDIPQDKEWRFGELSNGLRYAVRANSVPPGQISIRILMDVGSLYEANHERGYAHLLEHLVFRQSRYLGEAQAIPTWQRLGATFGSDTNAETSPTQTVYKLDLPNATPASMEESFKLLSGMMIAPTLSEANVRTEVPIVLAEMREHGGAQERVFKAMQQNFYAGQLLADRAVIGTVPTLEAAKQASVRAFHSRWYRPERAIIIVSGDADPKAMEAQVKKWFAGWKVSGKPAPSPNFGDPTAPTGSDPANPVAEAQVMVEPDLPRTITYALLRPWRQVQDSIVYNQGLMTDSLAQQIINRRLEAKARGGGSFLTAQVNQQDVSRSADVTYVTVTPLTDDWKSAVKDVRGVIADAIANPPTQEEIDREVAEMDIAFQVPVEQRELLQAAKVADDLVNAVDIRETVAAPEDVLKIFRSTIPLFTPASIHKHTKTLFSGAVIRSQMITTRADQTDSAALRQALLAPVSPDGSARLASASVRFDDMPSIGPAKPVMATIPTGLLGIDQLEFANGVKVLLWPTQDEPGRAAVKVRFGGGYRMFGQGDAAYIAMGEMALVSSGVANLGMEELDRISTGRKMGFDFAIDEAAFEFAGDTRAADLSDQLYLLAAKFALPRWDVNPLQRAKAAARLQYEAFATSPQGVLERDLKFYQRDKDYRFHTPTPAEIEKVTPEGFRMVWSRALNTGPIEVQVYGDFDREAAITALERSFGALAKRTPLPADAAPATARFPTPTSKPLTLTHRGDANQAAALIAWKTGGGMAGVHESRQLEILSQIFSNRLMEAMREKMGASYAPQVYSTWPEDLDSGGAISAMAQLEPDKAAAFFATAKSIAADLIARPASSDELARVTEPLRQQINRASTGSAFFMAQLEGATQDPSRIDALRSLLGDYTRTTPEKMQALAARYLTPDKGWEVAVVPERKAGASN